MLWCPEPALDVGWGPLFVPWLKALSEAEVCSPVVGVEALSVGFNKALLSLSACSVPKEVSAEASEARVVTVNLCTSHASMVLPRSSPKLCPFLHCVRPGPSARLVLGDGAHTPGPLGYLCAARLSPLLGPILPRFTA